MDGDDRGVLLTGDLLVVIFNILCLKPFLLTALFIGQVSAQCVCIQFIQAKGQRKKRFMALRQDMVRWWAKFHTCS